MKIIVANRNYFVTGGPEKYMFSLMQNMLHHQFVPFSVDFEKNLETSFRKYFVTPPSGSGGVYFKDYRLSLVQKARFAISSIYHFEARQNLERLILAERPDVAYFLNAVYFSDSIIDACRSQNIPIVWRMSDFHKVCSNYLLYRDGHVCEDCLHHGFISALRNRCGGYQRSLGAAAIKVAGMWLSRVRKVYDHVDCFVTPSVFTREKLIQGGFNPQKVVHIPTMALVPEEFSKPLPGAPEILYVGRLSHEKGVATLLEAFALLKNTDARLTIIGDESTAYAQQLKASIPGALRGRITFLGFQSQDQVRESLARAYCLVVPSVWYENQPNTVLEGMAHALPVVVSNLGSMKELIADGETGFRFDSGNASALAARLDALVQSPQLAHDMGIKAREYVLQHHSMENHLRLLDELFRRIVNTNL